MYGLTQSVDTEGRIHFVNAEWRARLGYAAQEASLPTLWEIVPREHQPQWRQTLHSLQQGSDTLPILTVFTTRSGHALVLEGMVTALRDTTGVVGILASLREVTEQLETEEALRALETHFRTFFDEAPVMYVTTRMGDRGPIVVDCNQLFLTTLGYSRSEVLERPLADFYSTESQQALSAGGYALALSGRFQQAERQLLTRNHRTISTLLDAGPLYSPRGDLLGTRAAYVDITPRKHAEERLQRVNKQLRELAQHTESVREAERSRLARELHDELGQMLTAIKMDVSWVSKRLPQSHNHLTGKLETLSALASDTIVSVQRLTAQLRPGMLDSLGLVAAMEWQVEEFQERTEIGTRFQSQGVEELDLHPVLATALFRILQEALTNVARHAGASTVSVALQANASTPRADTALRQTHLSLTIADNGIGITDAALSDPQAFGLIGMRERMHPWQGTVEVETQASGGTLVAVTVPTVGASTACCTDQADVMSTWRNPIQ